MIGAGKLTLLYHLVDGREQREEEGREFAAESPVHTVYTV